jgi:hypothetical protein
MQALRRASARRVIAYNALEIDIQEPSNEEANEGFAPQFRLSDWSPIAYTMSGMQGAREELSNSEGSIRMEVDMPSSELSEPREVARQYTVESRPAPASYTTGAFPFDQFIQSETRAGQRRAEQR